MIRAFYQRLLTIHKPKKLALTACMHKMLTILNAMVRRQARWSQALDGLEPDASACTRTRFSVAAPSKVSSQAPPSPPITIHMRLLKTSMLARAVVADLLNAWIGTLRPY